MSTHDPQWLQRFQQATARAAQAWLDALDSSRHLPTAQQIAHLAPDYANAAKAATRALLIPPARETGVALVLALWPHVELRGYLLDWQPILQQALEASRQLQRPDLEARALDQLGMAARRLGHNDEALAWQQAALILARELDDQAVEAHILAHQSQVFVTRGDLATAQRCCQEATRLFQALDDPAGLALGYNNWGAACLQARRWDEAQQHLEQAQRLFAGLHDTRGQAKVLNNLGEVHRQTGRLAEAQRCFQQAIDRYRQVGDELYVARTRVNLAIILWAQGDPQAALDLYRAATPLFRRRGDRPMLAQVANNEGVCLAGLGRTDEACAAFQRAADLHRAAGDPLSAVSSLLNQVEICLHANRPHESRARWHEAQLILAGLSHVPPGSPTATIS